MEVEEAQYFKELISDISSVWDNRPQPKTHRALNPQITYSGVSSQAQVRVEAMTK